MQKKPIKKTRRMSIVDTKFAWGDSDNMNQWPVDVAGDREKTIRFA